MPYPELMVRPMRQELTSIGVQELTTGDEVDAFFGESEGSAMLVINSVCGCAAGAARPAVRLALDHASKPDRVATVFAGQDTEATERARSRFPDLPPSSPSIILLKDGELAHYLPRHRIEGREAQEIAGDLTREFDQIVAART